MTASTLETLRSYEEQHAADDFGSYKRRPRLYRKPVARFAKRGRKVGLSANGRNRSRSVNVTMR